VPAPLPRSGTELTRAAVSPRLNNATAGAGTSGYSSTRSPGELTLDVLGTALFMRIRRVSLPV